MVNYGKDLKYYLRDRNNIKAPGTKSFHKNLCKMPFDRQIIKLRFNPR